MKIESYSHTWKLYRNKKNLWFLFEKMEMDFFGVIILFQLWYSCRKNRNKCKEEVWGTCEVVSNIMKKRKALVPQKQYRPCISTSVYFYINPNLQKLESVKVIMQEKTGKYPETVHGFMILNSKSFLWTSKAIPNFFRRKSTCKFEIVLFPFNGAFQLT